MEQDFYMTRLDLFEDLNQSVWNFRIKFDTRKYHWKVSVIEGKKCCYKWKTVLREKHENRESKSLDLTT